MNYCELLELQWITRNFLNYLDFSLYFLIGLLIFQLGYLNFFTGLCLCVFMLCFLPYICINYWIILFFCWVINFLTGAFRSFYWVLLRMFFDSWIVLNYSELVKLLWITVNLYELLELQRIRLRFSVFSEEFCVQFRWSIHIAIFCFCYLQFRDTFQYYAAVYWRYIVLETLTVHDPFLD
jgi:hypothetical protein